MFSILTPSRDYGRFLTSTIRSVQRQAVRYEHLIADALSTDETVDVLRAQADANLKWTSEPDRGQSDALNRLLGRATGDVIGWLNADEYYLPGALRAVQDAFDSHPTVDVVYGDTVFVDSAGRLERMLTRHGPSGFVLSNRGCYISTCAAFIREDALRGFRFDEDLRVVMDWDLFLHLHVNGRRFHYLARPLGVFRAHDARVTAQRIPRDSPEHRRVRERYGLSTVPVVWPVQRVAGDLLYATRKRITNSHARERASRRFVGVATEWTDDPGAEPALDALSWL